MRTILTLDEDTWFTLYLMLERQGLLFTDEKLLLTGYRNFVVETTIFINGD